MIEMVRDDSLGLERQHKMVGIIVAKTAISTAEK
jgi:hypothetical protein